MVTPEMLAAGKRAMSKHLAALDGGSGKAWDKALAEAYEAMTETRNDEVSRIFDECGLLLATKLYPTNGPGELLPAAPAANAERVDDVELLRLIAGTELDGLKNDGERAVMVIIPKRPMFFLYPGYRLPSSREPPHTDLISIKA